MSTQTQISSLLIVNVQKDFFPGGKICVPQWERVISKIQRIRKFHFDNIILTQQKRPGNSIMFQTNNPGCFVGDTSKISSRIEHDHCVDGTIGCELYPGLFADPEDMIVDMYTSPRCNYSSPFKTERKIRSSLYEYFVERKITRLYVCGIGVGKALENIMLDAKNVLKDVSVVCLSDACAVDDADSFYSRLRRYSIQAIRTSDLKTVQGAKQYTPSGYSNDVQGLKQFVVDRGRTKFLDGKIKSLPMPKSLHTLVSPLFREEGFKLLQHVLRIAIRMGDSNILTKIFEMARSEPTTFRWTIFQDVLSPLLPFAACCFHNFSTRYELLCILLNELNTSSSRNKYVDQRENPSGKTALMHACLYADVEVTKLLLSNGADVHITCQNQRNALMFAAEKNSKESCAICRLLLSRVPDVESRYAMLSKTDVLGWTPLHFAAKSGSLTQLPWDLLLDGFENSIKYLPFNAATLDGINLVHLGIWNDRIDVLKLLMEPNSCSPSSSSNHVLESSAFWRLFKPNQVIPHTAMTELDVALQHEQQACAFYLARQYHEIDGIPLAFSCHRLSGSQVLHNLLTQAIAKNDIAAISGILRFETNHINLDYAMIDLVRNINADESERTAENNKTGGKGDILNLLLLFSARQAQPSLISYLLQPHEHATANIDATNLYGQTALYLSVKYGHEENVKILLRHKANAEKSCRLELTPMMVAAASGNRAILEILHQANADLHAKCKFFGLTPLHFSAYFGHKNVCEYISKQILKTKKGTFIKPLIRYPAKRRALLVGRYSDGWGERCSYSPLALAIKTSRDDVVDVLIQTLKADPMNGGGVRKSPYIRALRKLNQIDDVLSILGVLVNSREEDASRPPDAAISLRANQLRALLEQDGPSKQRISYTELLVRAGMIQERLRRVVSKLDQAKSVMKHRNNVALRIGIRDGILYFFVFLTACLVSPLNSHFGTQDVIDIRNYFEKQLNPSFHAISSPSSWYAWHRRFIFDRARYGDTILPNRSRGFQKNNALVGSITLQAYNSPKTTCVKEALTQGKYNDDECYPLRNVGSQDDSILKSMDWEPLPDPLTGEVKGVQVSIRNASDAANMLDKFEQNHANFVGESTVVAESFIAAYNLRSHFFVSIRTRAWFGGTGSVFHDVQVQPYGLNNARLRHPLSNELVLVIFIGCVAITVHSFFQVYNSKCYLKYRQFSVTNMLIVATGIVVITQDLRLNLRLQGIPSVVAFMSNKTVNFSNQGGAHDLWLIGSMLREEMDWLGVYMLLSGWALVYNMQFLPTLGPLAFAILNTARSFDVIFFLALYLLLLLFFGIIFTVLFGMESTLYVNILRSWVSLFRVPFAEDYDNVRFTTQTSSSTTWIHIAIIIFYLIFSMFTTNLFIAIVTEVFPNERERSQDEWSAQITKILRQNERDVSVEYGQTRASIESYKCLHLYRSIRKLQNTTVFEQRVDNMYAGKQEHAISLKNQRKGIYLFMRKDRLFMGEDGVYIWKKTPHGNSLKYEGSQYTAHKKILDESHLIKSIIDDQQNEIMKLRTHIHSLDLNIESLVSMIDPRKKEIR